MGGAVQRLDGRAHGTERADGPRTFLRRFIEATGVPPEQWLIAEGNADAQRPLESSSKTARCQSRTSPPGWSLAACRSCGITFAPDWDWRHGTIAACSPQPPCALAGLQFSPGQDVDGDRRQAVGAAGDKQQNCC